MEVSFLKNITSYIYLFLQDKGVNPHTASIINICIIVSILLLILYVLDKFLRKIIVKAFTVFSNKTKTSFDDFLVRSNFPKYTAHIVPLIILYQSIPVLFAEYTQTKNFIVKITDIYLIVLIVWIFRSIIKTTREYLKSKNSYKDKPLDSFAQVIIIFVWFLGFIFLFSEITGQSILKFVTTLGAASAIILLLFKDTILGFVASIQVVINDMVRIGDWITLEKFGADGYLTEINLATVKVQNFDNTISTIPTYSLISDSFKNWRGMQESAGRRIKRCIYIKASSVHFLTPEKLQELQKINLIRAYIKHRQEDIDKYNKDNAIDKNVTINGRNQTNLGLFRKYIKEYLKNHPAINKETIIMVRHLEPTNQGIPLEVYAFSNDKRWENYEHIMADIFDHIIASVIYFDLEYFELPTGKDFLTP